MLNEALRVVRPGGRLIMSDLLLDDSVAGAEKKNFTSKLKAPNMWSMRRWDELISQFPVALLDRRDWGPHTVPTFEKVLANLMQVRDEFNGRIGAEIVDGAIDRVTVQYKAAQAGKLGWCFYALLR